MPMMPFSQPSITSPSPSTKTRGSPPSVVMKTVCFFIVYTALQSCKQSDPAKLHFNESTKITDNSIASFLTV